MTQPSPDFAQFSLVIFVVGLGGLVVILSGISAIYKNIVLAKSVRNPPRNPPAEEEAAKTYATKTELASVKCEMQTVCRANHIQVEKTHGDIFNLIRASQTENRTMMEALHKDLNAWQLGVERQIGHLEGKLENES
jgi:hypothetical protein